MSFVFPTLLTIGLSLMALPVLIHLINMMRHRRVQWAAMRFLRASVERNQRRMRIEDLLLLIIRCAIVALIALALSRPVLRSAGASLLGRQAVSAVILIDNSYSMSATDGVSSRFDIAKKSAVVITASLKNGCALACFGMILAWVSAIAAWCVP